MRLNIWRILAFPDYTLTLTLFQENNHAKLTLFPEALIHFVVVKRSRRKKYFFLIYFSKVDMRNIFGEVGFSKVDMISQYLARPLLTRDSGLRCTKTQNQKWTQYRVYFFLPFRVHFYNSISCSSQEMKLSKLKIMKIHVL